MSCKHWNHRVLSRAARDEARKSIDTYRWRLVKRRTCTHLASWMKQSNSSKMSSRKDQICQMWLTPCHSSIMRKVTWSGASTSHSSLRLTLAQTRINGYSVPIPLSKSATQTTQSTASTEHGRFLTKKLNTCRSLRSNCRDSKSQGATAIRHQSFERSTSKSSSSKRRKSKSRMRKENKMKCLRSIKQSSTLYRSNMRHCFRRADPTCWRACRRSSLFSLTTTYQRES